jgi:hypothetical protein
MCSENYVKLEKLKYMHVPDPSVRCCLFEFRVQFDIYVTLVLGQV